MVRFSPWRWLGLRCGLRFVGGWGPRPCCCVVFRRSVRPGVVTTVQTLGCVLSGLSSLSRPTLHLSVCRILLLASAHLASDLVSPSYMPVACSMLFPVASHRPPYAVSRWSGHQLCQTLSYPGNMKNDSVSTNRHAERYTFVAVTVVGGPKASSSDSLVSAVTTDALVKKFSV